MILFSMMFEDTNNGGFSGGRWILKADVRAFAESLSEIAVGGSGG
jgi:hypothetical protein